MRAMPPIELTVPFGAEAEVVLPLADDAAYEALGGHVLAPGTYEATYETTSPLRRMPSVDWPLSSILADREVSDVVRKFVHGFDYATLTADKSKSLRELQAEGLGQSRKMTVEELAACDAKLRELAD